MLRLSENSGKLLKEALKVVDNVGMGKRAVIFVWPSLVRDRALDENGIMTFRQFGLPAYLPLTRVTGISGTALSS